ncbi:hypothetical protein BCV70DRAFT_200617 [Testicularia cyperi]|uniref:Secreted protein n=1 Tax=Testicularia cyperi TaxID=1882483 RepID=A0A317XQS0_9BASI|nr:hypothetical protein BCV70DRAFT_200617 [Testicularia cyperi]
MPPYSCAGLLPNALLGLTLCCKCALHRNNCWLRFLATQRCPFHQPTYFSVSDDFFHTSLASEPISGLTHSSRDACLAPVKSVPSCDLDAGACNAIE